MNVAFDCGEKLCYDCLIKEFGKEGVSKKARKEIKNAANRK